MNTVNSATSTVEQRRVVYVTSEPQDSKWGQPAAVHYRFIADGNRLFGESSYVKQSSPEVPFKRSLLKEELEAWDELSDEALLNFEASLD
jgi:hypothetical protein